MLETFIGVLFAIFIYMSCWFVLALLFKRNDIADVAWGFGFIFVCVFLYFFTNFLTLKFALVSLLTFFWGLRLAFHIYNRNKGKKEDFRYKKWRDDWGKYFYIRTYLQVFLLQGFFMFLISFSSIVSLNDLSNRLTLINIFGVLVWSVGFYFESVGDYQLSKFIANPINKDKIMRYGLWKYTRHPNYFGEVTQWWGLFFLIFNFSLPITLIALISPITITFLILKVSGIPMLEKKYDSNLEFQEYKRTTNAFFPWFPKKS